MPGRLLALLLAVAAGAMGQFREPPRAWLPPPFADPTKLSPDRMVADEDPAITWDARGRLWVAWSSCRPERGRQPKSALLEDWQWSDDGVDSIVVRRFDGKDWSDEETISSEAGVNFRPAVVAEGDAVRVLWTSRRDRRWAVYERRHDGARWQPERCIEGTDNALTVRAARLSDGAVLALITRLAPPRIQLEALLWRDGAWQAPLGLDEGAGRCHRSSLLALPGGGWLVAWDEEREGNYDIFVRSHRGPAQRITESELWDTTPALERTPDGRIWLAWERKETIGGRFAYQGRSIFGKYFDGANWQWMPSSIAGAEPGRLTRHGRFWAIHGISEERYPKLLARAGGELWLFWLGGGRMSSTSFSARVWKQDRWSEPLLVFHDAVPYSAFALPSARPGVDLRSGGRGPYQTPLCNQMSLALDDAAGWLWLAYEVPKQRHITDKSEISEQVQMRPAGYGSDIYAHRVDLNEREYRMPRVVGEASAPAPLKPRAYRRPQARPVEAGGEKYLLAYGDLHGHTENDAIGTLDMYYAHGLMVAGMDFLASTNHDYTPDFLTQSEWAATQALAGVYNRVPGRAAFSGWEWTMAPADARGGHRAMFFLRDNGPLYRSTTLRSNTVAKLYELLRGVDVVLQPHHRGWEGYDDTLQPVTEIVSAWREPREEGTDLKAAGKVRSVWEALDRGYRVGFVGSGDTHWLGPGEDYGITGALVKEMSREGIFEAIRARRVFATTGDLTRIRFLVNGTLMGGQARGRGPARIEAEVTAESDIARVEIVRDHHVIHAQPGAGRQCRFEFFDTSPARWPRSYYYLRVLANDRPLAWSSPVWVDWQR